MELPRDLADTEHDCACRSAAGLSCHHVGGVARRRSIAIAAGSTLRPDHRSIYGYRRHTTPEIGKILRPANNPIPLTLTGRDFEAVDGRRLIEENRSLSQLWRFHDTAPAIAFSPAYGEDDTIFGFSDTQVFKSTDRGRTWRSMKP